MIYRSRLITSALLKIKQKRRINALDITVFLRQLATLVTAGIPLLHCFEILEKSQVKIALRLLIFTIKRELLSGKNLHACLQHHPQYFEVITCQLIKIGEHAGKLDITLNMIAEEHEKFVAFKKRIKQALLYPCIIAVTSLIVTLSMFLFVIPRFAELFADTHISLPPLTRFLFYLSAILQQYNYVLCLPFIFITFIFLPAKQSVQLKKAILKKILKLPLIQPMMQKMLLARLARNLAMTFSAGISITDALTLMMNSNANQEFSHVMMKLRAKINSGLQLHQAMQSLSYFPDLMIQMVKIGEESGLLDHLLNKIAGFFESDINHVLSQLNQLLEPLIMLVLGVLIGGLVIAMYLPIFKLGSAL